MAKTKAATADKKASAQATAATDAFLATAGDDDLLSTKAEVAAHSVVTDLDSLDWKNLERHELSEKYGPPVTDEEVLGIGADMEANGQHESIKLYEGKVLAGWTRYRAARQKGLKPRLEVYTGSKPEAVAFGTNVIRRRLSSVAKAFMGAQFSLATGVKQADMAKQCAVSLNRLNQCVQLLRLDTEDSRRAIAAIRNAPEMTGAAFEEILAECGIVKAEARTAAQPLRPQKGGNDLDDGADDDDLDDLEDDLTGGAIDGLTDHDEDELTESPAGAPAKRREIGEDAKPLPTAGGKASVTTKPTETIPSKLAKHFKNLPPKEQADFISFAWGTLQPALHACIASGRVKFEAPAAPAPKGKGKPAAAPTAPKKPQPPALAAAAAAKKAAKAATAAPPAAPAKPAKGKPAPAKK